MWMQTKRSTCALIKEETLNGGSLKLGDKFTYLGSSVSSNENHINMQLAKAWTTIDRLSVIWKSGQSDKIKFFQATVMYILLYVCTTWTLTKRIEKKLNSNCSRMLRGILNKSHKAVAVRPPTSHLKTIQTKRSRHAGHCWRSKDELISDIL